MGGSCPGLRQKIKELQLLLKDAVAKGKKNPFTLIHTNSLPSLSLWDAST